jgi:raffinose/stachyose/melibiose transport system substrate-binding protein
VAAPTAAPAAKPTSPSAAAPTTGATGAAAAQPTTAAAQPTTAAAKPAAAAPTNAPATTASGPVTIDLWMLHPEWKDAMGKVVAAFQAANPGITLNVMPQQSATYQDQVQTALNAGTGPDMFQAQTRPKLDVQAQAGQLLDLTGKVDTANWTQVAKDAHTINNKIWAVPGGKYTVGIAYHIPIFEKAGIKDEPRTWADMTEAFDKLKAANITPYAIEAKEGGLTYFNYIGLASSVLGLEGFNAVNAGTKKLTDDDVVAVIKQMMDWSKYYQNNFVGTSYVEAKALFATGKTAAMDAGSSDFNGYKEINPQANFGFMYWPAVDANHKQVTNTGMEFTIAVNAKAKHPDECVAFAKWLGSQAGAQSMTDNVRNLPVLDGVTPQDPLQKKMLATPLDVPVWYERFATQDVGKVWTEQGQGPFTGKSTAAEMAKAIQDSVDAALAQQKA